MKRLLSCLVCFFLLAYGPHARAQSLIELWQEREVPTGFIPDDALLCGSFFQAYEIVGAAQVGGPHQSGAVYDEINADAARDKKVGCDFVSIKKFGLDDYATRVVKEYPYVETTGYVLAQVVIVEVELPASSLYLVIDRVIGPGNAL
jgi:hypothetical protein